MRSIVGAARTPSESESTEPIARKRKRAATPAATTSRPMFRFPLHPTPPRCPGAERGRGINKHLSPFVTKHPPPERPYREAPVPRSMEYPPAIKRVLDAAGAGVGDTVAVIARGDRLEGVVMPHHAFSGPDILTLKLGNGYNVGIDAKDVAKVELVAKHVPAPKKAVHVPRNGNLPVLGVLRTGGTIASYVDYRTGAVHPAVTAEELVSSVPELPEIADVRARVVYSVYSENLKPANWQHLAQRAAKERNGAA